MRKLSVVLFLICLFTCFDKNAYADRWGYLWDVKAHNKGQLHMSYGYGFPRLDNSTFNFHKQEAEYRVVGVGPFTIKAEYGLTRMLSIMLSANYIQYTSDWQEKRFDIRHQKDLPFVYGTNATDLSVILRLNYHYNVTHRSDFYVGGGIGYNRWTADDFTVNAPDDSLFISQYKRPMPVAFEMTAGYRYYFRTRNAIYIEAGYGKSIVQAGFVFKFRQGKRDE